MQCCFGRKSILTHHLWIVTCSIMVALLLICYHSCSYIFFFVVVGRRKCWRVCVQEIMWQESATSCCDWVAAKSWQIFFDIGLSCRSRGQWCHICFGHNVLCALDFRNFVLDAVDLVLQFLEVLTRGKKPKCSMRILLASLDISP